ncbi:MAG: single-stranded DNA-binding protein [Saprospiraceae bacterium]|nr:MAG: single-stranded DNA-binding protein [Saprospiraceae bacterium]
MQQLINKVQLIGSLGKDVEFKDLGNGNAIARVSMATKEFYNTKDGVRKMDLQWHNLVAWGRVAEIMNVMLQKGKRIVVTGKLAHRTYEDKDGTKRFLSEVVVSEFHLMN